MNPQPTHRTPLQRSCQRPFVLLCLALLLGFGASAHAARRVALLIGNSQYQHETVLPNPVRDVALLERTLAQLGFDVDKAVNLDKRGMELAINRFASKTAGADTALVFYAGHGTQPSKGGRSFLLPVNAQVTDDETLETDGVPADDIASKLERTSNPAKLRLVILDACRSRKTSRGTDRGLAPPKPTDDYTLIAYSTNDGETADDGKGANSPYAQALAKLLPRLNKEPVRLVFEDTAREVRATTNHKQKPRTYGDLESRIGLDGVKVASVGELPTGQAVQTTTQADPEQEAWDLAKRRDTSQSYQAYLDLYANGRFVNPARIALEGLKPVTPAQPISQPMPATLPVQPGQKGESGFIDGRYEVLANGAEIKDRQSGLIWQRCAVGQLWSGNTCAGEAREFAFDEAQRQAGSAWRIPSIRELSSLIECSSGRMKRTDDVGDGGPPIQNYCGGNYVSPTIHEQAFPSTPAKEFWSGSGTSYSDSKRIVNFFFGYVDTGYRGKNNFIRLVRSGK